MSETYTFVDALLDGRALISDFEDWIDAWHEAPEDDPVALLKIHEYLGLTFEEYGRVLRDTPYLKIIVENRRHPGLAEKPEGERTQYALAARSKDSHDIECLVEQLR